MKTPRPHFSNKTISAKEKQSNSYKKRTLLFATCISGKLSRYLAILLIMLLTFFSKQSSAQGTWTPVATPAPDKNGGVMLLLSDGTVMAKSFSGGAGNYGNLWNKLTPDINGSYINGTWSTLPAMHDTRLYFSSQVLMDGRVFVAGGEYGSGGSKGETFDPLTNIWTAAPAIGHFYSDANSEILPDGRVLEAVVEGSLKKTDIFDPVTNTWVIGPSCKGKHNESVWVKLADNSILMVDRGTTMSERYIPSLNQWLADATVPVQLYDQFGLETGGAILLPDGRAFFLGSPGHTAYYIPSGDTSNGIWEAGPDIPNGQGTPDAAAAMMVNGKILCAVSPKPSNQGVFQSPTSYYEFDYVTNSFTQIDAPAGGTSTDQPCYYTGMLDLPDGTILYSDQYSFQYYVYTPDGAPLAEGKPTISSVVQNGCGSLASFTLYGTLLNGISEGASYGDDWQMNTNYPVVRLTSETGVYYARTFNWNSTGVQRGSQPDTTQFTLPAELPDETFSLVVTANGISSDPVSFNAVKSPKAKITPLGDLDICLTGSVDLKSSGPASNTYQWLKGINSIAGATNQTYTATVAGTYRVNATNSIGCSKTSKGVKVTKSCREGTGITELADNGISIYPNPNNGVFMIDLNLGKQITEEANIQIMNSLGQVVYLKTSLVVDGVLKEEIKMDEKTQAGSYFVRVISGDQIFNGRMIHQH